VTAARCRLADLAEVVDCEHKTAPQAEPGTEYAYSVGTPALRGRNIDFAQAKAVDLQTYTKWSKRAELRSGDIILAREAPVGGVGFVDGKRKVCLGQRTVLVRPTSEDLDSRFLFYALQSPAIQSWMSDRSTGSTVEHLNVSDVRELPLPFLPALRDQQRIANVLGAMDRLIEVNHGLITSQRHLLAALYRKVVADHSAMSVPLFDAVDVDFGGAFKGEHFSNAGSGMPLLRIRDLKTFSSATWTTERLPGDVVVQPGDVVIGMDAEFRPTLWLGPPSLLNQRVCRIRPKLVSRAFAREALVAPMAFIEGHKTGTTVSHLNKADLQEVKIPLPSREVLESFDAVAEPLRLAIVSLHKEIEDVARARDELLPLLLSGRVRVREAVA
jgi:type I restriction enzyme S subunit